jgi:CheY-like chemotaxis protein
MFLPFKTPREPINTYINTYIDKIEGYTERLETSYNNSDMHSFVSTLKNIQEMLKQVYAKRQEAYTITLIRSAQDGKTDYCQKILQQSIADFLLLSIEMQKAQSMSADAVAFKDSEIEKLDQSARDLTAVINLIEATDYDSAKSLLEAMNERGVSTQVIINELNTGNPPGAKTKAQSIREDYFNKIKHASAKTVVGTKTVLAVDDRPEILTSVTAALRDHYKTLGAPGAQVALEILGKQSINLFILDIDMPEMDGFELAKRIRSDKKHRETPIIFLTGNASRNNIIRAIDVGADDFLVKPTYNETLLIKAKKYLG